MDVKIEPEFPDMAEECLVQTSAWETVRWPEMVATLTRLGVKMDRPYQRIVLNLDFVTDGVHVYLVQRGADTSMNKTGNSSGSKA